ncbi:MAG TPA: biotin--[acetyl-CoA-carboxylase] ligase [Deltaproteobacteria bacterium]|nr:MAG: biotin--[acetyl-CoA-carboxylase] ligase [Deltaproteobacteria bacterium GWA2_45_12]HBF12015.1 biotin--[acetyl-CoA-carboxylase] ligase [Deltaproteobacteria bacterium]
MDIQLIKQNLKTKWLGKTIHFEETTDSTNGWALQSLQKGARPGEVFLTHFQTKGHGRLKRTWESPKDKNILVSFIDSQTAQPEHTYQLTLVAGVAILEALENRIRGIKFELKWPNDILVNGKKLGGILCEKISSHPYAVIGFGLNVNVDKNDFSPEIKDVATSLLLETSKPQSREEIIAACFKSYERWRQIYDTKGLSPVIDAWNRYSAILGQKVTVTENGKSYEAIAKHLTKEGFLVVETGEQTITLISADVSLR